MSVVFTEIADRVYVLRHPVLDVNVTLVVGAGTALVIDTLSTPAQAAELVVAARTLTPDPWTVVNTHHHFDHCFGNAVVAGDPPGPVYAHAETAARLRDDAEVVRRQAYDEMRLTEPALAEELAGVAVLAPTHPVRSTASLDIGGRPVVLRYLGRGHTAGDLTIQLPDVDVLIAGDLVEESGPPHFAESYPLEWPETVAALLRLATPRTIVVPGHGAVVDVDRVHAQHADLTTLAWLIRDGHADDAPPERVAAQAPFGPRPALDAVRRGYAELTGDI